MESLFERGGLIEALEKVQRRATRIPATMRALEYEERLKIWDLTTLKERRERGDIIQMFKTMNGLEDIQRYTVPHYDQQTCTRDVNHNSHRLVRESFPTRSRNDFRHFISVREEFSLNRTLKDGID